MCRYLCLLILLGTGAPLVAEAVVEISEVAWMGGVSSPNHEWIELVNTGSAAVVVDDWTVADGSNLLITLTGTIPAGAYVVLERTSEDSAPGAAFLLYTGALVNTGATLTLRQPDGQIVDRVEGGSDWGAIGGDNTTKATAQRVGGGWRTGTPTPGSTNTATGVLDDEDEENTPPVNPATTSPAVGAVVTTKRSSGGGETIPLRQAASELTLTLTVPTVAYERQPVAMKVVPSGIGRTIAHSLNYQWNFGDFTTATGSSVTHRFTHPGTYLVTVRGHYGRHDVVVRQPITVLPVTLSLTRTDDTILLHNDAVYDLDVSGFEVQVGKDKTVLPPYSYLAARQSVPLGKVSASPVTIRDGRGEVVFAEPAATFAFPVATSVPLATAVSFERAGSINTAPRALGVLPTPPVVATPSAPVVPLPGVATATERETVPPPRWPYLLLGLLLIGAVTAVLWPRSEVSPFPDTNG